MWTIINGGDTQPLLHVAGKKMFEKCYALLGSGNTKTFAIFPSTLALVLMLSLAPHTRHLVKLSLPNIITRIIVISLLSCIADGCYRRSARPLTTPPPEPDINPQMPDVEESHKKECYDYEERETRCLHGGSCFAIEVPEPMSGDIVRSLACQ